MGNMPLKGKVYLLHLFPKLKPVTVFGKTIARGTEADACLVHLKQQKKYKSNT